MMDDTIRKILFHLWKKTSCSFLDVGIIKEVGSFCRCKHPTLVRYYGLVANKEDFNFWLVTEFVTGHSLASLVHNPEVKSLYKIR